MAKLQVRKDRVFELSGPQMSSVIWPLGDAGPAGRGGGPKNAGEHKEGPASKCEMYLSQQSAAAQLVLTLNNLQCFQSFRIW